MAFLNEWMEEIDHSWWELPDDFDPGTQVIPSAGRNGCVLVGLTGGPLSESRRWRRLYVVRHPDSKRPAR